MLSHDAKIDDAAPLPSPDAPPRATRRYLQNEIALGGHRHRNGVAGRRRDDQFRVVLGDRIVHLWIGKPVLTDDRGQ